MPRTMAEKGGGWLLGAALLALSLAGCRRPLIDPAVAQGIADRVASGEAPGAVALVFNAQRVQARGFGVMAVGSHQTPDEHTLFEVGSITKVFTALLLADMARQHEVDLDDPAERWIKPPLRLPRWQGRPFTLLDLATHRSGLQPDAAYLWSLLDLTRDGLTRMLPTQPLTAAPGQRFQYSNLGYSILGRALADRAGQDFDSLLTERILQPLGLRETFLTVPPALAGRVAQGVNPLLHLQAGAPCGGLKSSAADLGRFLRQNLGQLPSPLHDAMALTQMQRPGREPMALGWFVWPSAKGPVYGHAGSTLGSRAYAYFRPSDGRGVVLLYNSVADLQDLAFALLDPAEALKGDWSSRASVDAAALERLSGRYALPEGGSIVISSRPDGLSGQVLGSHDLTEFEPQGPLDFVNVERHRRLHFNLGPDGRALSVDLRAGGLDWKGNLRIVE